MRKLRERDLRPRYYLLPKFEKTSDIKETDEFIGQERARKAMLFGLSIKERGYNIFVVGPVGTGRRTFSKKFLRDFSKNLPVPDDWVYVFNFEDPLFPLSLRLRAGMGKKLKKDMEKLVDEVLVRIQKSFESEEFSRKRAEIEDEYARKKNEIWNKVVEAAKELGFLVQINATGVVSMPVMNGKPVTPEMYDLLPDEKKREIDENSMKVKHLIEGALHRSSVLDREMNEKLKELSRDTALFSIGRLFEDLKTKYREFNQVVEYLENVKSDILENLDDMRSSSEKIPYYKVRYSVNLLVDNSNLKGAPVIYEPNPTYSNLFGKIEYTTKLGMLVTDFTMIRPGALHRANGGFLIVDAEAVLKNPHSWEGLKRALVNGILNIENMESFLGFSNTITLKPEPIPLNVKVIMIGTNYIYSLLYNLDDDFSKLFKVKSEFDPVMEYSRRTARAFVSFLESVRKSCDLPEVSIDAVKEMLWYSNKLAGSRKKLSARLGKIGDLLRESAYISKISGKAYVDSEDVLKAIEEMEERVNLYQEKYDDMIRENKLLLEVEGFKIGQINGLTVLDLGDYTFGLPVKITAKTFLGKSGVIDIHREADLSGKIHSKAVLTLEGFFGSRYARKFPISLAVSLSFEQVYSTLEGDSASLAEVLAIISAISEVPIDQGIAVTGSINQSGEVQAVGGVTEKVEGFFRVCKQKGLTGKQGVVLPKSNVDELVLNREVIEAVRNGKFHIWAVEDVDQAIEIVMKKKAGKLSKKGNYRKGTVNRMVCDKLREAREYLEGKRRR